MRQKSPLDPLLSKTVQAILAAVMMQPDRWWYLSDLAKHVGRAPSSVQGPLAALVESGILRRREDGNRVYFQPDRDCPFFSELQGIILKTVGLVDVLHELLDPFRDGIELAFVYGSLARGEELSSSDIDLMLIGEATRLDLTPALREAENRLGRPVNVTVYKPAEFSKKLKANNHFLRAVLDKEKLFILGDEHDLDRARSTKTRRRRARGKAGA